MLWGIVFVIILSPSVAALITFALSVQVSMSWVKRGGMRQNYIPPTTLSFFHYPMCGAGVLMWVLALLESRCYWL